MLSVCRSNVLARSTNVSISALSDRIAQLRMASIVLGHMLRFNIRSFGSNCSAGLPTERGAQVHPFQYPLFRIELLSGKRSRRPRCAMRVSISALSDRIAQHISVVRQNNKQLCFNIRSFGSNCSAGDLRRGDPAH